MRTFVESRGFTASHGQYLDEEAYISLQNELLETPTKGRVMPGCGGLRKLRLADPKRGKGKRGGVRVIYLDIPEAQWIALITIYDKDEKENLSADEKKVLRALAEEARSEAGRRALRKAK